MNRRYLEIDSTYRNRALYTNPSSFTVLISQSGTKTKLSAYDPIAKATPVNIFSPDDLILNGGTTSNPANPIQTKNEFFVCFPVASNAVKTTGYYVGSPITVASSSIVIITSWEYLSSDGIEDCFFITVSDGLTASPGSGDAVTFVTGTTNLTLATIFIPGGISADSYYNNLIVWNQTLTEYRPIISYDGDTKIATLDISPEAGGPVTGWATADTLVLRHIPPQQNGTLTFGTSNTVTLPSTSSNIIDFYTGDFIRFTSLTGTDENKICRITKYTGSGQSTGPSPFVPIDPYISTLDCSIGTLAPLTGTYEILNFTKDNANPFVYTGSMVSQQEMVCYEIKLVNLVLPNITLVTGGRIAFYPYVYIELQNISSSSAGNKHVIYSNNPNATRMLFRAAISDISNPLLSPFIKIDADGMVQTVKFKPNDNFKFAVYLPNGTPFQTVLQDSVSPEEPNILVQISALFELKRL